MELFEYIKTYNYTFEEKPFNEVDNVILSMLAYADYENIVSNNRYDKKRLETVADEYYENKDRFRIREIIPAKVAVKVLKAVKTSPRFKDLLVYNYEYLGDDTTQFSALTFESDNFIYIAYEGTDALISGWEEDFKMSYTFPVPAHKKAIKYLKKYTFSKKKIILGGHSKGGNLAIVAAMFTNYFLNKKIVKIYSNDGPGLRLRESESARYKKISNKIIHIMPQNTIVGVLFTRDKKNDVVIKSNALPGFSHDASSWKIDKDSFVRTTLNKGCKILDESLYKWLLKYNYEDRKHFIDDVFNILKQNNIVTLYQIMEKPMTIVTLIRASSKLTDKTRIMFNDFTSMLSAAKKEYK